VPPVPPDASAAAAPVGPVTAPRRSVRRTVTAAIAERSYFGLTILAGLFSLWFVGYFIWTIFRQTRPVWQTFGAWGFVTGTEWVVSPAVGQPVYGALPMIYGTLTTAAIAMVIALPLSIGVALATSVFLPRRARAPLAGLIDLLAAIPSVVFGLWGIVVMVPAINPALTWITEHQMFAVAVLVVCLAGVAWLLPAGALRVIMALMGLALLVVWLFALVGVIPSSFRLLSGPVLSGSYMSAGLILGVMVLPIMTAIIREVFATVPREQEEAAYALGATRWEMVRDALLPWSRSGIVGATALGFGRAIGETIAIAILLGNSPNIFGSLFGPGATLASKITNELGEASGLQLNALVALALILFGLALLTNVGARLVTRRNPRSGGGANRLTRALQRRKVAQELPEDLAEASDEAVSHAEVPAPVRRERGSLEVSASRRRGSALATGAIYVALAIAVVPLGLIAGEMLIQGIPEISWTFLTALPPIDPTNTAGAGIGNAIVGTAMMVGVATLIAAPLGILTALLMYECSLSGRRAASFARIMGLVIDIMLGIPSIVVGMFGYLAIVIATGGYSGWAGAIALAIIMVPIIVRAADEVLRLVPAGLSEAALALGAPKWRTALRIVIPAAAPGILTGIVLAVARAAGETAPLLFTAGVNQFYTTSMNQPMSAVPEVIFNLVINTRTPQSVQFAWGATLVLVTMILVLNLIARLVGRWARGTER
jgi:phosphate transport system permease protein